MKTLGVFAAAVLGVLAWAPLALAQTSTGPTSGLGEAGGVQGAVGGGGGAAAGNLPFTGVNLLFLAFVGFVLLAVGLGLRAVTGSKS